MPLSGSVEAERLLEKAARPRPHWAAWFAGLTLLMLACCAWSLPLSLRFQRYLLFDHGANLWVQHLLDQGLRPGVDFGYQYGVLPLLVGRAWSWCFGLNPWSYQALATVLNIGLVLALVRGLEAVRAPFEARVLTVCGVPFTVPVTAFSLNHGVEAVLLAHAFSEHLRGRHDRALALCTAAVFAKPALAYPYGLLVLIRLAAQAAQGSSRTGVASFERSLRPAIVTGLGLAGVLAAWFGPVSLLRTIVPVSAVRIYDQYRCGFFTGLGRNFWRPPAATVHYYLTNVAGYWLVASVLLLVAGLVATWRIVQRQRVRRTWRTTDECVVVAAALHLTFVSTMFAGDWSWSYYAYLLLMGLVAAWRLGRFFRSSLLALAILAALGCQTQFAAGLLAWSHTRATASTAGLWETNEYRAEWERVRSSTRDHHSMILVFAGAAPLWFSEFEGLPTFHLARGVVLPLELQRDIARIEAAERVVIPSYGLQAFFAPASWPEFEQLSHRRETLWSGRFFRVLGPTRPLTSE